MRDADAGDDDLGAARVEFGENGVAVERLVGDQRVEGQSLDEGRHAYRVEALSRQKHEGHEIAERIAGARILVVMPPFEWPIAWLCLPLLPLSVAVDLDDGGVDYGVFHVGIAGHGVEQPLPDIRLPNHGSG